MFDLNISPVDDIFIVDIGSEKGRKIVDNNRNLFQAVRDEYINERLNNRQRMLDSLKKNIKKQGLAPKGESIHFLVEIGKAPVPMLCVHLS